MKILKEKCVGCEQCLDKCPLGAITVIVYAVIDQDNCAGCGSCKDACPVEAIVEIHGNC